MVGLNEASGLDHVELPADQFHSVVRHDINFPAPTTLREMILPGWETAEIPSRIGKGDVVKRDEWDAGWNVTYDLAGLKGIVSTYPHKPEDPEMIKLWDELGNVLGDGTVEGAWLVSLSMATKNL